MIRTDRIARVVVVNGRLHESIVPVRRAAPDDLTFQEQPARRTWVRTDAERVFATEVAGAGGHAEAVVQRLSFEVPSQARSSQGLSPTCGAASVVTFPLTALPGAESVGDEL